MIDVDCDACESKGCCTFQGWKVFFLQEEKDLVANLYGEAQAAKISQFQPRKNGTPAFVVTLPCPFFDPSKGTCGIYNARPLICRIFPVELEPITGATYLDQAVCPKRADAKFSPGLVQIAAKEWCDKFWQASPKEEALDQVPVLYDPPGPS
jgi:Fe-S-cluster containining protein